DVGGELLLRTELRVRGGGRMDRQAARVADIGDVVEQLESVDEAAPGLLAALELEADQAAEAVFEIDCGVLFGLVFGEAGEDHAGDLGMVAQIAGDRLG